MYKDPEHTPHGIDQVVLKAGAASSAKAKVILKGENTPMPGLGALPLPLRVQVQGQAGSCLEATFGPAGVRRHDGTQFKGKSD